MKRRDKKRTSYIKKILYILKKPARIFGVVTGVLFVVYFWNLDQKAIAKFYTLMNKIFDRKKEDRQF